MKLICGRTTFIPGFCALLLHSNGFSVSLLPPQTTATHGHQRLPGRVHCHVDEHTFACRDRERRAAAEFMEGFSGERVQAVPEPAALEQAEVDGLRVVDPVEW